MYQPKNIFVEMPRISPFYDYKKELNELEEEKQEEIVNDYLEESTMNECQTFGILSYNIDNDYYLCQL